MTPAKPPFPDTWKFPFQPFSGSQTSKFIDGDVVPITRQIVGSCSGSFRPGGVNDPAGSIAALFIVVFGRTAEATSLQVAAYAGATMITEIAITKLNSFMGFLVDAI